MLQAILELATLKFNASLTANEGKSWEQCMAEALRERNLITEQQYRRYLVLACARAGVPFADLVDVGVQIFQETEEDGEEELHPEEDSE